LEQIDRQNARNLDAGRASRSDDAVALTAVFCFIF